MNITPETAQAFAQACATTAGKYLDGDEARLSRVFFHMSGLSIPERSTVWLDLVTSNLTNLSKAALKLIDADDPVGDEIILVRQLARSENISAFLIRALDLDDDKIEIPRIDDPAYESGGHPSPDLACWQVRHGLRYAGSVAQASEKKELALFRAGLIGPGWWNQ